MGAKSFFPFCTLRCCTQQRRKDCAQRDRLIIVPEKDFAEAEKIVDEWRRAAPDELPWDESLKRD